MDKRIPCNDIAKENLDKFKEVVSNYKKGAIQVDIIQVGSRPDSTSYVKNKLKRLEYCGIIPNHIKLDEKSTAFYISKIIKESNMNNMVKGIILQLPLPDHLKHYEQSLTDMIAINKDIDGLTSKSVADLSHGSQTVLPCTVQGVIDVMEYVTKNGNNKKFEGSRALVIGRSNIVGKPLVQALLQRNVTPMIAHSRSNVEWLMEDIGGSFDWIILATGAKDMFDANFLWGHHCVIDVGITFDDNGKLRGDLTNEGKEYYSQYYTPVPGGIGPLTTSNVVGNTLRLMELI